MNQNVKLVLWGLGVVAVVAIGIKLLPASVDAKAAEVAAKLKALAAKPA